MFNDPNNLFNVVLPTVNRLDPKYCKNLVELFTVSDAVTYQELWLKFPQIFSTLDDDFDRGAENYDSSVFRKIEQFAMGKTVAKTKLSASD